VDRERVIGVDLGGTKILAGIVDREGSVTETVERPTPTGSQEELLDTCAEVVRELRAPGVGAVGFGVPARVDERSGLVLGAVNIPLADVRVAEELGARLGLPTGVVNDAGAAALAEHRFGAGRGVSDLVLFTLGTGVGGGVVSGGRLYRGWAELGHMVIVEGGEPCQGACTGHGHVEGYCSGAAADRLAERILGPGSRAHDLVEQRHPALAEIGRHLGAAIASAINVFAPELVLIGGGFGVAAGEILLPAARPVLEEEALSPGGPETRIALAELGFDAGLIGAGLIAYEALGYEALR
jgi:glucokinase